MDFTVRAWAELYGTLWVTEVSAGWSRDCATQVTLLL